MEGQGVEQRADSEVVRPNRRLWRAAWAAFLALTVPVFVSLYWLTFATDRWLPILAVQLGLVASFAITAGRLRGAGIELSADGIRERAYFRGTVFIPATAINSVLRMHVHDLSGSEIHEQVFLLDAAGNTLLRLRGPIWHAADIDRVAEYYGVPARLLHDPLTWREVRASHRKNLGWFERHPILATIASVSGVGLIAIPIFVAIDIAIR